jgi:hypothetical protein
MTDDKHDISKHDKDAQKRHGKGLQPPARHETKHENEKEKGSGEGVTGMQRGAGHPTGR